MEDEIVTALNKYWDDEPETSWRAFTAGYLCKSPHRRILDLKTADGWIGQYTQEHNHPSKELASLIMRRRELEDLHRNLLKVKR